MKGAVEAAVLGRDGLLEGGDAVDDVQGQTEAPKPFKDVSRKAWLPNYVRPLQSCPQQSRPHFSRPN